MKNCLILGCGRSGTSTVAGILAGAGYFMGEKMMPPWAGNPKGNFESFDIEAINEELIALLVPARPKGLLGRFFQHRPITPQRWLAQVAVNRRVVCPPDLESRIKKLVAKQPFCFKDPRFCYTLPVWRSHLTNTVFISVFRNPSDTALSILKECRKEEYLQTFRMNFTRAVKVWNLMYDHILTTHMSTGKWLFVHYNQLITQDGISRIEQFTEANVDREFPDISLKQSKCYKDVGKKASLTYQRLCELAKYRD